MGVTATLRCAAVTVGAVALLSVSGSRPASGQYLGRYKAGIAAIEAEDWEGAARAMEEAIAERSEEKGKLPIRLYLHPYVPHFYLGYARFRLGDCAGALAEWDESDRQGVLRRLPEAGEASRGREECDRRAREEATVQARGEALQELAAASATAAALLDRGQTPSVRDLWARGDPSPRSLHQHGTDLLRQAGELLEADGADGVDVERAGALVGQAAELLAALATDLDGRVEARRRALAEKDQSVDARVAQAQKVLEETSYLEPYPRSVRKARADLEGLVAEARRRDAASQAHLEGLAARLEGSIENLDRVAAAPPQALDAAARAYLAGRHDDVIAALSGVSFNDSRARAHAHLLLAASRLALYLEGGELDDELRSAAAADVRACRRDDERLTPSERFFSPRFVAFFEQSLVAAQPD